MSVIAIAHVLSRQNDFLLQKNINKKTKTSRTEYKDNNNKIMPRVAFFITDNPRELQY